MGKILTKYTSQPVILSLYILCSLIQNLLHHLYIVDGTVYRERHTDTKGRSDREWSRSTEVCSQGHSLRVLMFVCHLLSLRQNIIS